MARSVLDFDKYDIDNENNSFDILCLEFLYRIRPNILSVNSHQWIIINNTIITIIIIYVRDNLLRINLFIS